MSSWAQQREAIRRAAQGGVRARTNAQGSQRLPLANNRLREVLLSRPNGELTRAGQFYYGLVGGRPPSRQFDEEQPLIREGPTDYILLRSGVKKAVRSLQPDGSYHLTKLGKSFFREKYTDWLAHVPVRITGTRQRGRNAGRPSSATTSCPSPWSTVPCPGSPAGSAISRPTPASRRPP